MTSNASQVLGVMLRDIGRVNGAVTALNSNLAKTKIIAVGAMTALAGTGVLVGLAAVIGKARELNDELSRMKMLGGEFAASIGRTRDVAFQTTFSTPTTTAGGNVQMQRELAGLLGDPELARQLVPEVSKAAYVASFYTQEDPSKIAQNLLKAADVRGALLSVGADGKRSINWEALKPELEWAIKALVIQGGMLKSGSLLQMISQGSVPFRAMSAQDAYIDMSEIASTFGGAKTGTALTSLFQQFIGGKMTKQTAEALTAAGMLRPGDWTSGRSGGVVVTPAGTRRFAAMEGGPAQWFANEGQAKIKAYAEQNGLSEVAAIFRLFGRQTTQRLIAEIQSSEPQIARSRQIAAGMPGYEAQYAGLLRENLTTNITAFSSAWTTLMKALGEPLIPTAIKLLQGLTDGLQAMTKWALANPDIAHDLTTLAAGFAAVAATIGLFAVGTAVAGAIGMLGGTAGLVLVATGLTALAVAVLKVTGALDSLPAWLKFWQAPQWPADMVPTPQAPIPQIGVVPGGMPGDELVGVPFREGARMPGAVQGGRVGGPGYVDNPFGRLRVRPPPPPQPEARGPVPVIVTNPDDVRRGQERAMERDLRRPAAGPSFIDPRAGMYGGLAPQ